MITRSELLAVLQGGRAADARALRGAKALVSLLLTHNPLLAATFALEPPVGYYVIIGRGLAAWYNHLTLVKSEWGRRRLATMYGPFAIHHHVIHIGYPDPWSRRKVERMGQWGRMLNYFADGGVPLGLGVGDVNDPNWLPSDTFAESLRQVQQYLNRFYRVLQVNESEPYRNQAATAVGGRLASFLRIKTGFAGWIERRDDVLQMVGSDALEEYLPDAERARRQNAVSLHGPLNIWHNLDCPYRVSVFRKAPGADQATLEYVYAYKIDVCTGPGTPRTMDRAFFGGDDALYDAHVPKYDEVPRPRSIAQAAPQRDLIINGNDYIGSDNDPNERCVIFKGNAVGAQSVQSALDMPSLTHAVDRAYFVANGPLYTPGVAAAWVPGARNQLEIAGSTADADLQPNNAGQIRDLDTHFNALVNPFFEDARDTHQYLLRGKLFKLEYHEIGGVRSVAGGQAIQVSLVLNRYGQAGGPIPAGAAANAHESVVALFRDALGMAAATVRQSIGQVPILTSLPILAFLDAGGIVWSALHEDRRRITSITADFLVYSLGQDLGADTEGTPGYLCRWVSGNAAPMNSSQSNFPSGISCGDVDTDLGGATLAHDGVAGVVRHIRILGAAMLANGLLADNATRAMAQAHATQYNRLPKESTAAAGGGINPSLTNIRRANHFTAPNLKVNTASHAELVNAGLTVFGAHYLIARRAATDRGYTVAEYIARFNTAAAQILVAQPGFSANLTADAITLAGNFTF